MNMNVIFLHFNTKKTNNMSNNPEIRLVEVKREDHPFIETVDRIYHSSFPPEERRDFDKFLELMYHNDKFTVYAILKDEMHIGFITVWELDGFSYVEHFAIDEAHRGGGTGQKSIMMLLEKTGRPFILEVEPPVGEMEVRRINFYKRCGFILNDETEYFQPPYREGELPLELKLMSSGDIIVDDSHIKSIHRNVYGKNI